MKIRNTSQNKNDRRREGGMAVIVVLALLTLILIYVAANIRALSSLQREVKLVETQQIRRLENLRGTNRIAAPFVISGTNAAANPAPAAPPATP